MSSTKAEKSSDDVNDQCGHWFQWKSSNEAFELRERRRGEIDRTKAILFGQERVKATCHIGERQKNIVRRQIDQQFDEEQIREGIELREQ
jgi:hypothetical protein